MEKRRDKHHRVLTVFMFVLCLFSILLTVRAIRSAEKIHAGVTYDEIYEIKKTFLKDTVRNFIGNIGNIRAFNRGLADEIKDRLVAELERMYDEEPDRFQENAPALLERGKYPGAVHLELKDTKTGLILFRSPREAGFSFSASAREHEFGPFRLRIDRAESWVDDNTKASIATVIHDLRFENGGYIWVNEILNWEGGDDYAIRRIHPNLRDTEGTYLSTNTRDIEGNLPYMEELTGIRDHGEVFFTYFFKRPDNDRIARKLTYAAPYVDYDWIVAMGVYLEDVQVYIDAVEVTSRALTTRVVAFTIGGMLALFILALIFLSRMEGSYVFKTSRAILMESNIDPLTGAYNRRLGDGYLADTFNKFRHGTESSALLLLDIDDFKRINDRYGHKSGDLVLQAIVSRMKKNMRASDHLIRWGGEEFLIICYGIDETEASVFAEKMRRLNETMDIPISPSAVGEDQVRITISIGIAWFLGEDLAPEEALLRADRALYRAKAAGKNCVRFQGGE